MLDAKFLERLKIAGREHRTTTDLLCVDLAILLTEYNLLQEQLDDERLWYCRECHHFFGKNALWLTPEGPGWMHTQKITGSFGVVSCGPAMKVSEMICSVCMQFSCICGEPK